MERRMENMKPNEKTTILNHNTLFDLAVKSAYVIAKTLDERYADKDRPEVTPVIHWYH